MNIKYFTEREIFLWVGAIVSAITLLSSLEGFLKLADWAAYLIDRWSYINKKFWNIFSHIIDYEISKDLALMLSFVLFLLALTHRSQSQRNNKLISKRSIFAAISLLAAHFFMEYFMLKYMDADNINHEIEGFIQVLLNAFIFLALLVLCLLGGALVQYGTMDNIKLIFYSLASGFSMAVFLLFF